MSMFSNFVKIKSIALDNFLRWHKCYQTTTVVDLLPGKLLDKRPTTNVAYIPAAKVLPFDYILWIMFKCSNLFTHYS